MHIKKGKTGMQLTNHCWKYENKNKKNRGKYNEGLVGKLVGSKNV